MNPCVFCQIWADELPASVVYRDEYVMAFMDIQPVTPGHILVVPQHHVQSLECLPTDLAKRMMGVAQAAMSALRSADLRCEGVNLFLADGEVAGQEVGHVHLHVIPRFQGDGFGLRLPSDYGTLPHRAVLDALAASIKQAMTSPTTQSS